jgi:cell division protease FtsH
MDKEPGHVAYERDRQPMMGMSPAAGWHAREFSDETERLMDHAVRDLVGHAFDRAIEFLKVHRAVHERTAELLLQKETLEEGDLGSLRGQIATAGASEPRSSCLS